MALKIRYSAYKENQAVVGAHNVLDLSKQQNNYQHLQQNNTPRRSPLSVDLKCTTHHPGAQRGSSDLVPLGREGDGNDGPKTCSRWR